MVARKTPIPFRKGKNSRESALNGGRWPSWLKKAVTEKKPSRGLLARDGRKNRPKGTAQGGERASTGGWRVELSPTREGEQEEPEGRPTCRPTSMGFSVKEGSPVTKKYRKNHRLLGRGGEGSTEGGRNSPAFRSPKGGPRRGGSRSNGVAFKRGEKKRTIRLFLKRKTKNKGKVSVNRGKRESSINREGKNDKGRYLAKNKKKGVWSNTRTNAKREANSKKGRKIPKRVEGRHIS